MPFIISLPRIAGKSYLLRRYIDNTDAARNSMSDLANAYFFVMLILPVNPLASIA